ncbi:MAG: hypothetical protein ACK4M9_07140 [Anaerobacillus sp.]|uniref:hypothetical protein n=1 Tax=Anaerobacillus sp. TaxID=1872506 RepID=UPI00391B1E4B
MKPWQIKLTRFFHLSLEMVLLFLIMIPLYFMEGKELPIIAFSVLVVTAMIFYDPFIRKFKNEKIGLLLIPIMSLLGISVGFHFFLSLIIVTTVFWRVLFHNKDNDPNEMGLFIATFVIGVVFYLHFFYIGANDIFLLIIFLQFFLVLSLKTIKLAFQSTKSSTDKWTQMKWQLGSFAALGGITIVAIFSYEIIYSVVTFILKQIFYLIWLLGVPFIYLASLFNFDLRRRGPAEEGGFYENPGEPNLIEEATTSNLDMIIWIVGAVLLVVVLFFIFKRSGSFILREYMNTNDQEQLSSITHVKTKKGWFRSNRPKNEIRRLIHDFEKFTAKLGQGRNYNETIEDWFTRINASEELKNSIAKTYRRVRYGEKEITKEEKAQFIRALKELKKAIKKGT